MVKIVWSICNPINRGMAPILFGDGAFFGVCLFTNCCLKPQIMSCRIPSLSSHCIPFSQYKALFYNLATFAYNPKTIGHTCFCEKHGWFPPSFPGPTCSSQVFGMNKRFCLPTNRWRDYPLVICHITMEKSPFILSFPIKNGDFQ